MLGRVLLALLGIGIAHADVIIFQGTQFDENQFIFSSARSGADPKITVGGSNSPANISIDISAKGNGQIKLLSSVLFPDGSVWNSGGPPVVGNASQLLGATWASPPALGYGSTTPEPVAATTLAASGAVSGAGFSNYLASPPGIGGTAPGAGAFTTLAASGAVSGNGFSNYLASPPAIGGTTPAAGSFTTIAASGAITPSQTNGIVGTNTNNSANTGSVGEYLSSIVSVASQISLSTGVVANVTSLSVSAGDWDCWGNVVFNPAGGTTISSERSGISATSATFAGPTVGGDMLLTDNLTTSGVDYLPVGTNRQLLSGTTTLYLLAQAGFATSTMGASGIIACRRMR